MRTRVDFPLQCYFELDRRSYTITVVRVKERHADGRTAANMLYPISIVTFVRCIQKTEIASGELK